MRERIHSIFFTKYNIHQNSRILTFTKKSIFLYLFPYATHIFRESQPSMNGVGKRNMTTESCPSPRVKHNVLTIHKIDTIMLPRKIAHIL